MNQVECERCHNKKGQWAMQYPGTKLPSFSMIIHALPGYPVKVVCERCREMIVWSEKNNFQPEDFKFLSSEEIDYRRHKDVVELRKDIRKEIETRKSIIEKTDNQAIISNHTNNIGFLEMVLKQTDLNLKG